jgi:hypothetical protein
MLYPALLEIAGGIPEPIFDETSEAESLEEHGKP